MRRRLARAWWIAGLAIAAVVVVALVPFASSDPDGLGSVAAQQGFESSAQGDPFQLIPGYAIPGLDGTPSKIIAGLIGVAIVFLLVVAVGRLAARRRKSRVD